MFFFVISITGCYDDEDTKIILAKNEAVALAKWKHHTPNYQQTLDDDSSLKLYVQNLGDATSGVSKVFTITTG
jgi:hypothetical protein